jgi:adenylate cyclase
MNAGAWQQAGLYDPDAPGARERLELLEHLAAGGITLEDMVRANEEGTLITSLSDRTLRGERTLTVSELAEQLGETIERVERIWLSLGLPLSDAPLPPEAAELTAVFFEAAKTFGEESTLGFSRVMASAAAQVAEAAVALFLGEVQPRLEEGHASELERAVANEEAIMSFGFVGDVLGLLVREHAIGAVRRSRAARGQDPASPQELEVAVCFVDLVGSTAWAQQRSLREQAVALARFETAAFEEAVRHDGRLVKLIGDEAMVIAPSAVDASAFAVALCDRVSTDEALPAARAAVGYGTVLFRDGDYFGTLVNVVARAVKTGEPGEVVVTTAVREQLLADGTIAVGELTEHHLRGIDEPVALAPLVRPG